MKAAERAVVVTGASTGIGEATARRLAGAGFTVYAGVRKPADAERLGEAGLPRLKPLILDVTDAASIDAAAELVGGEVGEAGLAGLVNNAGVAPGGPVELMSVDEVRAVFEVNVFAVWAVTQAFVPLVRKGHGRITVTGSIGGRIHPPFVSAYGASKAAVAAICDALRIELRPWGIEVSLIEPGSIATPIWEKGLEEFDRREAGYSEEGRRLYGAVVPKLREFSVKAARRGIAPDRVAQAIEHALTAPRPKTRYLVGSDARMQATIRRLPDRVRDSLLVRYLGIEDA